MHVKAKRVWGIHRNAWYVFSKDLVFLTTFVLLISPNCKVTSLSSFDDAHPFRQPQISNSMGKHPIKLNCPLIKTVIIVDNVKVGS